MSSSAETPLEPLLLTYQQARRRLGVSISQLYRLMRQGEIRSLKLGPKVRRISDAELVMYVKHLEAEQHGDAAGQGGNAGDVGSAAA